MKAPKWHSDFQSYQGAKKSIGAKAYLNANEGLVETSYQNYPRKNDARVLELFSKLYGVRPDQLLIDSGIDGILDLLFRVFTREKAKVLTLSPSYKMYQVLADTYLAKIETIELDDQGNIDDSKLEQTVFDVSLIIICRPNNPTGTIITRDQLNFILDKAPSNIPVVVDEAYAEFMREDECIIDWINKYENLLITRTLSKAYSLAGLRVGFALGMPSFIQLLNRFQMPFPTPQIVIDWLIDQFNDQFIGLIRMEIQNTIDRRNELSRFLSHYTFVYKGEANFVSIKDPRVVQMYHFMQEQGIETRLFKVEQILRISVGNSDQHAFCLNTLKRFFYAS
jgi:histidinol-phosphate aminotransferase